MKEQDKNKFYQNHYNSGSDFDNFEEVVEPKRLLYFEQGEEIFNTSPYIPITTALWAYRIRGNKIIVCLLYLALASISIITLCLDLLWLGLKPVLFFLLQSIKNILSDIRVLIFNALGSAIKWFMLVFSVVAALFLSGFAIYVLFDSGKWVVVKDFIVKLF